MQHQFFRALALRAQEALDLYCAAQRSSGNQSRVRLESDGADLGLHLALRSRLVLLGLVSELEFQGREARGRVAQRAALKQPGAQL